MYTILPTSTVSATYWCKSNTQSYGGEPVTTRSYDGEPVTTQSYGSEPVTTPSYGDEPVTTRLYGGEPVTTRSYVSEPVTTQWIVLHFLNIRPKMAKSIDNVITLITNRNHAFHCLN